MIKIIDGIETEIRVKKVKRISIRINDRGKVFLNVPSNKSISEAEKFLLSKKEWILKNSEKAKKVETYEIEAGRPIYIFGKKVIINTVFGSKDKAYVSDDNLIVVSNGKTEIVKIAEKFLTDELKKLLSETFDKWTNITMTFERKKQADGTYVAEITELFVAGKQIGLGTAAGAPIRADWWTGSACTEGTLAIRSTNKGNRIDNVLIYEPEDRKTETIVTKSSYMPEIKTLIADDGFENRPADQRANEKVTYAIPHPVKIGFWGSDGVYKENSWGSYVRKDSTAENQYLELQDHPRSGPYTPGATNADRIAVSFEMGYKTGSSGNCEGNIYIGNSPMFAFQLYSNTQMKLFYNTEGGDTGGVRMWHIHSGCTAYRQGQDLTIFLYMSR